MQLKGHQKPRVPLMSPGATLSPAHSLLVTQDHSISKTPKMINVMM